MNRAPSRIMITMATLAASLCLSPSRGHAEISIHWSCPGEVRNLNVVPGSLVSLWVMVQGHQVPHRGYEFRLAVSDGNGDLPDAWRFDAEGCQGTEHITIDHAPPSTVCPPFQGTLASTQVKSFSLATPDLGLPATTGVIHVRNDYALNTRQVVSAQSYALAQVIFDHSQSVTGESPEDACGGIERALCLTLLSGFCFYRNQAGTAVPFTIVPNLNSTLTVNGGSCVPVPSAPSTWGQIKGQYRR